MKNLVVLIIVAAVFSLGSCTNTNTNTDKEYITLDNITAGRPYSPAVKAGNILYVSGQIAVDPATGKLVEGDISDQTRQVLENMKAIVEKAGYSMSDVVKCNVLMDTITFYGPMNKVYLQYFSENPPARKAFAVESLPLGAMVEIDAIAIR